jgi:hypothetical protein
MFFVKKTDCVLYEVGTECLNQLTFMREGGGGGVADFTFKLTDIESVSMESFQTRLKVGWVLSVHRKCTLLTDSFPFPLQLTFYSLLVDTEYEIQEFKAL